MNHRKQYDLIVVGGGFSGVMAASAAARGGMSVLLIEKSGTLGGAASLNYVLPFMKFTMRKNDEMIRLSRGLFSEFLSRMEKYAAEEKSGAVLNGTTYSEEYLKLVLDDMTDHYGVQVLFHSYLTAVKTENGYVRSVSVSNVAGNTEFSADYFIDATGDAQLSFLAGTPYHVGRYTDEKCQPMTLCFRMGNVDVGRFYAEDKKRINDLWAEKLAAGEFINPRENVLTFRHSTPDVLHLNSTRVLRSPVDPWEKSAAEKEARRQMLELYRFLRRNAPSCENATLLSSGVEIGVRESRMIEGLYTVTAEDIAGCRKFEDAIAAGNYDMDIHSPDGSGTSHVWIPEGEYYTIPYRALVASDKHNLLAVGRCISSTHEAQAAYRIIPIVSCIGEGGGIAAALAFDKRIGFDAIETSDLRAAVDAFDLVEGY